MVSKLRLLEFFLLLFGWRCSSFRLFPTQARMTRRGRGSGSEALRKPTSNTGPPSMSNVMDTPASQSISTPKIPSTAWRWPPAWPFADDMLTGVDAIAGSDYDTDALEKLEQHFEVFMNPSAKILEIGSSSNSAIPPKYENVARLSLTDDAFNNLESTKLTADKSLPYESNSFDYIVVSSGVEGIEDPRDLFKEIWRVLKPEGRCLISFQSKPSSSVPKPMKMWTTMTDEQKIWIAGSYYQYSAGDGFQDIEGYDLFDSSKGLDLTVEKKSVPNSSFIVHATKASFPSVSEDIYPLIDMSLKGTRYMDTIDKKFVGIRLNSTLQGTSADTVAPELNRRILKLQQLYAVLKDIKEVVFPTSIKAMLAMYLVDSWKNTERELQALRMAVGLDTPDEAFWQPLGVATSAITPRDKINFLARTIAYIGSDDLNEDLVKDLPSFLMNIVNEIELQLAEKKVNDADCQLIATELIICEYLTSKRSSAATQKTILNFIKDKKFPNVATSLLEKLKARWEVVAFN